MNKTLITKEFLHNLYIVEKKSVKEISIIINRNLNTTRKYLNKFNIKKIKKRKSTLNGNFNIDDINNKIQELNNLIQKFILYNNIIKNNNFCINENKEEIITVQKRNKIKDDINSIYTNIYFTINENKNETIELNYNLLKNTISLYNKTFI